MSGYRPPKIAASEITPQSLYINRRTLIGAAATGMALASAPGALAAAKRLMRQALAPHLGGRPLVSRELFMTLKESKRD